MATPSNYAWRRDKNGLGVWEHRGKVAVAGNRAFARGPALGRRLDGQDPGRLFDPRVSESDGRSRCHGGPDRRGDLLRQPHRGRERRLVFEVGAAAVLCSTVRLGVGPHADQRRMAREADEASERQVRADRRAHDRRDGRHGVASGGRWGVHDVPRHLSDRQPRRPLSARRRERRRLRTRRTPVDGAVGQSRRERLHQHLSAQPVLPEVRRRTTTISRRSSSTSIATAC